MSRELATLIRLRRWGLDQERRRLTERLGALQARESALDGLEAGIMAEQEAAKAQEDETGFAYAAFARAAVVRRADLVEAIAAAEADVARQRDVVGDRWRDVRTLELAEEARRRRDAEEAARRERIEIDEIAVLARCRAGDR